MQASPSGVVRITVKVPVSLDAQTSTTEFLVRDACRPPPRLPRELAGQILGAVNAREWSGYAPLTWLCTNFSSRSDSGVVVVEFEALYNPDSWRVRHELQIAGRVPEQATIGNGIGVFDVYPEFDFNRAGLTF